MTQGKNAEALAQLLRAKELDPSSAQVRNHLGLAYYMLGELERAVVELEEAIDIDENFSEAHNNIARVLIDLKEFKKAREHLFIASNDLTYSRKDKVLLNQGLSYFFQGQYKKSEPFFLKSISRNRDNCLAYNYYGRAKIEQESFVKASKALEQAVYQCKDRGFDEPHYYSGIALFRLGKKTKAIARLQEGRKKYPKGPNRNKISDMINLMRITDPK